MSQIDAVIALARLALAFWRVNRATFHEDGQRPETDTDHTVMLGLIACALAEEDSRLDANKVARYVLIHDLIEARCGDTNTLGISAAGKTAKAERERVALASIEDDFGSNFPSIPNWIHRYEAQTDPESRFVRYLDKATPKITHMLNGCAAVRNMGLSAADLAANHDAQFSALAEYGREFPQVAEILRELMDRSVAAYREEEK